MQTPGPRFAPDDGAAGTGRPALAVRARPAESHWMSRTRALIEHATPFAGILLKTGDGLRDERVIIGHTSATFFHRRGSTQVSNGLCTSIVSSRSGLVESNATGQSTNSSIRRTYFIA